MRNLEVPPVAVETTIGEYTLIEYTPKTIAVFGNTEPIKDELRNIRGLFNPRLKKSGVPTAGWIVHVRRRQELILILTKFA